MGLPPFYVPQGRYPLGQGEGRGGDGLNRTLSPVALIGILDDGWAGLSDSARQRLTGADVVIGAGRTLALVGSHLAPTAELIDMDGKLGQVPGWMLAARDAGKTVVALALSLIHI